MHKTTVIYIYKLYKILNKIYWSEVDGWNFTICVDILLYNVCLIGPNAEVDGWNYYVRGPTTWPGPLHTQYKKHYSLVLLSTKTISQTCGESTIWTNVSGKCYSEIWLCYHIRYKNNVSRTGLIHPHSYTLMHAMLGRLMLWLSYHVSAHYRIPATQTCSISAK